MVQHLSPDERALRRHQRLEERKALRKARRDAYVELLEARRDFKGKLHNLVVATFVGLDEALLRDDVPFALECAQRLGMVDSDISFAPALIRRAQYELRDGEKRRRRGGKNLMLDRVDTLSRMRHICPSCGARKPKLGMWVWPRKDRNGMPVCRSCGYKTKPGYKATEQPPDDMICPGCKRHRPKRRQWCMKKSPVMCRKCARRV